MNARRRRDGSLWLTDLTPPVQIALARLPAHAASGPGDVADARLFPVPDAADPGLRETWEEIVVPELRGASETACGVVRRQLRRALKAVPQPGGLVITPRARDAWMHVLTRARVAMVEHAGFTDAELEAPIPRVIGTERELLRWEFVVYGILLEWLVELASGGESGTSE